MPDNRLVVLLFSVLIVLACSASDGDPVPSDGGTVVTGTSGMSTGTGGDSTQVSSSGMPAETSVAGMGASSTTGMGASSTTGIGTSSTTGIGTSSTTGIGASNTMGTGGAATGAGGATSGGITGTAAGGTGASAGGVGGMGGSGGTMDGPVVRPPVEVASTVPPEYASPVANPGNWTPHTYPVYYYTTQTTGLSPDDTLERQSSPIMKPCNVYTPPDYDPEVEYPLILVLHGITDDQNTWMERGNPKPDVLLDNLITAQVIEPVIAVFPQGDASEGWASHDTFSDTAGYMVFGDELMNDRIPYIEANYSVKKDRGFRALSGFSFGGMQTVNIGLSHLLKDFAWFGAYAAAGGAYGATQIAQYLEAQNTTTYPLNHFYAMAGSGDSFGAFNDVTAWEQQLPGAAPSITSENFTTHVISGAHDYPTVTVGLYNFLRIAFGI